MSNDEEINTEQIREKMRHEPGVAISNSKDKTELHLSHTRTTSYSITHPVRHVFDPQEKSLALLVASRPVLLAIDHKVYAIYGKAIERYVDLHRFVATFVLIESAENQKSWTQVEALCETALRFALPRDGIIVGIGGGVTLDIAGMGAALFRRGVGYIRIPTTLIGLVDVCVGIKQSINFQGKKNLLGAFYPPIGGINDLSFLRTLPPSQLGWGIAEIIKLAMVRDEGLFGLLEEYGTLLLNSQFQQPSHIALQIALRSEYLMMAELHPNLYETSYARLVDFGHTFSPAIESASSYQISHGQAVALDILISTCIAVRRGLCPDDLRNRLVRLYQSISLPLYSPVLRHDLLMKAIDDARLHRAGDLNLVLPVELGHCVLIQDVDVDEIRATLQYMEMTNHEAAARTSI